MRLGLLAEEEQAVLLPSPWLKDAKLSLAGLTYVSSATHSKSSADLLSAPADDLEVDCCTHGWERTAEAVKRDFGLPRRSCRIRLLASGATVFQHVSSKEYFTFRMLLLVSASVSLRKGLLPLSITKITTPKLHMSEDSSYGCCARTSGAAGSHEHQILVSLEVTLRRATRLRTDVLS